jgi:hypothetical protein
MDYQRAFNQIIKSFIGELSVQALRRFGESSQAPFKGSGAPKIVKYFRVPVTSFGMLYFAA